ncbi:MAG: cbb3-type cytochrome oxidase assembly protein CcoS [Chlorobi bacterium]|nr:cbb3-type cytochrome oxidase assembly protein CcoS [Chlorobiota bacterium]
MSAMLILIGFSLTVAIIFLVAFLWAVKSGQYKDKYTPSIRMLFDDKKPSDSNNDNHDKK